MAGMLARSKKASPDGRDNVSYCAVLHETLAYFINFFGQLCVFVFNLSAKGGEVVIFSYIAITFQILHKFYIGPCLSVHQLLSPGSFNTP